MLGSLKRTNWWLAVAVLLILAAYAASYAAIVQRSISLALAPKESLIINENGDLVPKSGEILPAATRPGTVVIIDLSYNYRWGGKFAEHFFLPINRIERRFRSEPED